MLPTSAKIDAFVCRGRIRPKVSQLVSKLIAGKESCSAATRPTSMPIRPQATLAMRNCRTTASSYVMVRVSTAASVLMRAYPGRRGTSSLRHEAARELPSRAEPGSEKREDDGHPPPQLHLAVPATYCHVTDCRAPQQAPPLQILSASSSASWASARHRLPKASETGDPRVRDHLASSSRGRKEARSPQAANSAELVSRLRPWSKLSKQQCAIAVRRSAYA
jgi:hypothetical protein